MGDRAMKFLAKKSWHMKTEKAHETKMKAIADAKAKEAAVAERIKLLQAEREAEARHDAGLASGQIKGSSRRGIEWMYSDAAIVAEKEAQEAALLGKEVNWTAPVIDRASTSTTSGNGSNTTSTTTATNGNLDEGDSSSISTPGIALLSDRREQSTRLREDPLLGIKKEELAAQKALLANPAKAELFKKAMAVLGAQSAGGGMGASRNEEESTRRRKRRHRTDRTDREPGEGSERRSGKRRRSHHSHSSRLAASSSSSSSSHHNDSSTSTSAIVDNPPAPSNESLKTSKPSRWDQGSVSGGGSSRWDQGPSSSSSSSSKRFSSSSAHAPAPVVVSIGSVDDRLAQMTSAASSLKADRQAIVDAQIALDEKRAAEAAKVNEREEALWKAAGEGEVEAAGIEAQPAFVSNILASTSSLTHAIKPPSESRSAESLPDGMTRR